MLRKIVFVLISLMAFGVAQSRAQANSPVFVFVHGAFQDESGWASVMTALKSKGYSVLAIQNAGRGGDKTPTSDISLATYRDAVLKVVKQQDQPVILVGHSFGGMIISSVAEAAPEKVKELVYLAAYLPRNGESLVDLSMEDKYSILGKEGNFIIAQDYSTASVNKNIFAAAFCPDCTPDQTKVVAASQVNEPLAPLNEKITLTAERFGGVKKTYILTAQDVVVSPQLQALMIANTPVDHVYAVNAGHAAYITVSDALAEILIKVVDQK